MTEQERKTIESLLNNYESICKRYLPNAGITERLQITVVRQIIAADRTRQESQTVTAQQAVMF